MNDLSLSDSFHIFHGILVNFTVSIAGKPVNYWGKYTVHDIYRLEVHNTGHIWAIHLNSYQDQNYDSWRWSVRLSGDIQDVLPWFYKLQVRCRVSKWLSPSSPPTVGRKPDTNMKTCKLHVLHLSAAGHPVITHLHNLDYIQLFLMTQLMISVAISQHCWFSPRLLFFYWFCPITFIQYTYQLSVYQGSIKTWLKENHKVTVYWRIPMNEAADDRASTTGRKKTAKFKPSLFVPLPVTHTHMHT